MVVLPPYTAKTKQKRQLINASFIYLFIYLLKYFVKNIYKSYKFEGWMDSEDRWTFLLRSCCLIWARQRKHWLTLTKALITSKWTGPAPNKQPTKITQGCAAQGGGLKLLLQQTSLHTEPTGEPLQLNRSFYCADKQLFPKSQGLPLSEFTWGLGATAHVSDRGQSQCVFTNARNTGE